MNRVDGVGFLKEVDLFQTDELMNEPFFKFVSAQSIDSLRFLTPLIHKIGIGDGRRIDSNNRLIRFVS